MSEDNQSADGVLEELSEFCRSDSLSEEGLQDLLEELYVLENIRTASISNYEFFHDACFNERVTEGIIRLLLEYFPRAASSLGSDEDDTPLHYICGNKNVTLGMVRLLIDAYPESLSRANDNGYTPLHSLCDNEEIDEEAALDILKLLLQRCPESVRHTNQKSNLPIHIAAAFQSPEFCRILIEAYPGSERMPIDNGALPIHAAFASNTTATAKYLYQLYPESINMATNNAAYPIHYVLGGLNNRRNKKEGIEVMRFLLDCNPNAISPNGGTSLHFACRCYSKHVTLDVMQLLIDAFPDSLCQEDINGYMPLHCLCENNKLNKEVRLEILKLLLERYPEAVRHATNRESLPIHIAAGRQSPVFCRILIEAYPGSERVTIDNSALPFHWACQGNTVATVEYFYKLYPESISMADNDGEYPIHSVIWGLKEREGDDLEAAIEVTRFLLDCNTDVALQKHQDKFPLYWVCDEATNDNTPMLNAYLEILQVLYDAYPEAIEEEEIASDVGSFCQEVQTFINTQLSYARQARDHRVMTTPDENGQLPLHRALRDNAALGSIKLLVKGNHSATRNFDDRGMIPLHVACQHHDSPSVVEYMIDLRSSALEMEDRWQNTLLHFACRGANNLAIIVYLLEKYDAAFVSKRNSHRQLPIDLLFGSEAVSNREGIEYMESIYRLIRANPETVMGCVMNMNERQQAQSEIGKKRKVDDMK